MWVWVWVWVWGWVWVWVRCWLSNIQCSVEHCSKTPVSIVFAQWNRSPRHSLTLSSLRLLVCLHNETHYTRYECLFTVIIIIIISLSWVVKPESQSEINIKMENNNDNATLNPKLPPLNSFIIRIFKRLSANL